MRFSISIRCMHLMVVASLSFYLAACGGCKKKSSSNNGGAVSEPEPEQEPTETPTPTPTIDIDEDVGEATPPITPDKPITIDTDKKAALRKLTFGSSDTTWAGRHTTEYLIAIRSIEDSCVRIKMRPTDGLTVELDDESSEEQGEGRGACEKQVVNTTDVEGEDGGAEDGTADAGADEGEAGDSGEDGTALRSSLQYVRATVRSSGSLRSNDPEATICAPRLFRMPIRAPGDGMVNGLPEGLDEVVTKTGRLLGKGTKVRIWIDEEFTNVCNGGGGSLNDVGPIDFAPWIQDRIGQITLGPIHDWIKDQADQLRQEQVDALVVDMDKIYSSLTATYGPISDIDSSGFVEIFLTPELNRSNFSTAERLEPDDFQAQYLYRPQDLAYYNPESNPISNEGEILYLWSPDPAGIYNPNAHPSANSIVSNYAKGFLTSQLMNLVYINERLIKRNPSQPDEAWLISGLAQLASAYYAGIDFTKIPLAHYMTGRGQNISLTDDQAHRNESEYAKFNTDEANGMRTMFMWYLHSRVCKTSAVTPCEDLKKLLTSSKAGKANVQELLGGEKFPLILSNFGLAVGVSLTDNPSVALDTWANLSAEEAKLMPPKPQVLPDFTEIYKDNPHQMPELELKPSTGNPAVIDLRSDIPTTDRTQSAPFPSKKMLMFQPITTDNEIEFATAKDSVTYILVTGLVDQETHATAAFGKGLNVTFIPIGDLDQTKRKIHFEKFSENAIADLRPANLTRISPSDVSEFTTYRYPPAYDPSVETYDLSVTTTRDLWILGSIDNYEENIDGAMTKIGDYDAYNVSINPCEGLAGAELTACQAGGPYEVLAQVYTRDFLSELKPMLVATDFDRKLFRGHGHLGNVLDVHPEFPPAIAVGNQHEHVFCLSDADAILGAATFDTASDLVLFSNHGLADGSRIYFSVEDATLASDWLPNGMGIFVPYLVASAGVNDFQLTNLDGSPVTMGDLPGILPNTYYVHSADPAQLQTCANGSMPGNELYTDWVMQDYYASYGERKGWAHNFVNYLAMGPHGFPYTNIKSVWWEDNPARDSFRMYFGEEASRQFLNFAIIDLEDPDHNYRIWSTFSWSKLPIENATPIVDSETIIFENVRNFMAGCTTNPDPDSESGAAIISECSAISGLPTESCEALCTDKINIANTSRAFNTGEGKYLLCDRDLVCPSVQRLMQFVTNPNDLEVIPPLLNPGDTMFINTSSAPLDHRYHQDPSVVPYLMYRNGNAYCEGETTVENQLGKCEIDPTRNMSSMVDIRQAFATKANRMSIHGCRYNVLGQNVDVCIDRMSTFIEIKEKTDVYAWLGEQLDTDRPLLRYADYLNDSGTIRGINYPTIYERAGEIVGKPLRVQYELFDVPGTQESVVNLIVGGRKLSQGKYLLRVRIRGPHNYLP